MLCRQFLTSRSSPEGRVAPLVAGGRGPHQRGRGHAGRLRPRLEDGERRAVGPPQDLWAEPNPPAEASFLKLTSHRF